MTRTGARAARLDFVLGEAGWARTNPPRPPRLSSLSPQSASDVLRLYRDLGGRLADPTLAPSTWDLSYSQGLVVELDEEFHFTRYRAETLLLSWTSELPWASTYARFCHAHEDSSVAAGGRWSNTSSDRMFGGSDPVGVFGQLGSSRGKQRALWDAIKDAAAGSGQVMLSRISIYDEIDGVVLGDVLYGKRALPAVRVAAWVASRATGGVDATAGVGPATLPV